MLTEKEWIFFAISHCLSFFNFISSLFIFLLKVDVQRGLKTSLIHQLLFKFLKLLCAAQKDATFLITLLK